MKAKLWLLVAVALVGCEQPQPEVSEEEAVAEREQLEALGYVNWVPDRRGRDESGVTRHEIGFAADGLNLFNLRHENRALLMAMNGRVVHRWASGDRGYALAHIQESLPSAVPSWMSGWNHVELTPDGDLLVIGSHHMLLRLAWNSRKKWRLDIPAHHDLALGEDGRIHVLVNAVRRTEVDGRFIVFQDDAILTLGADGVHESRFSIFDAFRDEPEWSEVLEASLQQAEEKVAELTGRLLERALALGASGDTAGAQVLDHTVSELRGERRTNSMSVANVAIHDSGADFLHANSLQVLPREEPGLWRRGDFLVCLRDLDLIAVIDAETGALLWTWGRGELEGPHHATQLEDGTLLVFDNGVRRGHSRLLRIDPARSEIVWRFVGDPPSSFYSHSRGGCQPLSNGNVLVTETNTGRAFEITPDGEIVWEYLAEATRITAEGSVERSAIYRMTRVEREAAAALPRS